MESNNILQIKGKKYIARLIYEREDPEMGLLTCLYEAWDTALQRQVALKEFALIRPALAKENPLDIARCEARLLAQVGEHPNLPLLYDIAEEGGRLWLEMEFVRGVSLAELYLRPGAMLSTKEDILEVLEIALDIGHALQALHQHGIAHRDVSPNNIIVGKQVKLIDLGLAVRSSRQAYRAEGEGTVGYRAPEQTAARDSLSLPGPASDVYGLAAVLYHVLTATPPPLPLPGRSFPRPSQVNPALPRALDDILTAALALAPKERPPIGQFVHQLRKVRDSLRHIPSASGQQDISLEATQSESFPPALETVAVSLAECYNEGLPEPLLPPEPPPLPRSPQIELPPLTEQVRARWIVLTGAVLSIIIVVLLIVLVVLR